MKKRTINLIICNKFDAWLATITDESVRDLVAKNTICTGGSIATMLLGEPVNDFDFYFRDYATTLAVAKYYVKEFMSNPPKTFAARATGNIQVWVDDGAHRLTDQGEFEELPTEQHTSRVQIVVKSSGAISEKGEAVNYQYFEGVDPNSPFVENYVEELTAAVQETEGKEKSKYRPVFLTANAITLSDKVQLVLRFYGDPEGIHENYDFVHACNFWTSWERKVTLKAEALESLMAKELRYIGSKYPVCSIFRVRKFLNRGFSITAGQLFKICHQISELNLSDFDVLREQLTGVDTAYFEEVIKKVKAKGLDSNTVDSSYLMQLIDGLL